MDSLVAGFSDARLQKAIDWTVFAAGALSLGLAVALTLAGVLLPGSPALLAEAALH